MDTGFVVQEGCSVVTGCGDGHNPAEDRMFLLLRALFTKPVRDVDVLSRERARVSIVRLGCTETNYIGRRLAINIVDSDWSMQY